MGAAAELFRAHGAAGREAEGHSEDRLGVVALSVHDEQVSAGSAESVECQELVLAQPVILCRRLAHMALPDNVPKRHSTIVRQDLGAVLRAPFALCIRLSVSELVEALLGSLYFLVAEHARKLRLDDERLDGEVKPTTLVKGREA